MKIFAKRRTFCGSNIVGIMYKRDKHMPNTAVETVEVVVGRDGGGALVPTTLILSAQIFKKKTIAYWLVVTPTHTSFTMTEEYPARILYFLPSALCEEPTSTRDLKCDCVNQKSYSKDSW
jgi:hypothetical protein